MLSIECLFSSPPFAAWCQSIKSKTIQGICHRGQRSIESIDDDEKSIYWISVKITSLYLEIYHLNTNFAEITKICKDQIIGELCSLKELKDMLCIECLLSPASLAAWRRDIKSKGIQGMCLAFHSRPFLSHSFSIHLFLSLSLYLSLLIPLCICLSPFSLFLFRSEASI